MKRVGRHRAGGIRGIGAGDLVTHGEIGQGSDNFVFFEGGFRSDGQSLRFLSVRDRDGGGINGRDRSLILGIRWLRLLRLGGSGGSRRVRGGLGLSGNGRAGQSETQNGHEGRGEEGNFHVG